MRGAKDVDSSKPNAGIVKLHSEKDNVSAPASAGGTLHPEKQDGKNRQEPLSKTGTAGGTVRPQKQDSNTSNPQGGSQPIPRERLDLAKVKYDSKKESR